MEHVLLVPPLARYMKMEQENLPTSNGLPYGKTWQRWRSFGFYSPLSKVLIFVCPLDIPSDGDRLVAGLGNLDHGYR